MAIMVQIALNMFEFDAICLPRHHEALWLPGEIVGHSSPKTSQNWEFWLKLPRLIYCNYTRAKTCLLVEGAFEPPFNSNFSGFQGRNIRS